MKRFNFIFITSIFIFLVATATANIVTDIYKIFDILSWNKTNVQDNARFRKIKYLENHSEFNAFLLGSSRINFLDSAFASELSNYSYYNLAVGSESIEGMEQKLDWLLKTRKELKQLIIGLEYDVMFMCPSNEGSALFLKEHPEVSGENKLSFYLTYLFHFNLKEWRRTYKKHHEPVFYKADLSKGLWYYIESDRLIEEDHDLYLETKFVEDTACDPGMNLVSGNIERYRQLLQKIQELKIPTKVFIAPYHEYIYNLYDQDEYQGWVRSVTEISGEVWDFSGLNAITTDNRMYYETSHYRWEVGNLILRTMFSGKPVKRGFGKRLRAF